MKENYLPGNHPNTEPTSKKGNSRRRFIQQVTAAGVGFAISPSIDARDKPVTPEENAVYDIEIVPVNLLVNGEKHLLQLDPRVTLLDALRENLSMPGTKKGCDRGQCGACTVLVNGRRVNACLTLAALCDETPVTTIEGLAKGDELHPMQRAFIKHDAFQCGYCTPGQICSAVGMLKEGHAHSDNEIRELMSGNICRCGAYDNILAAIREVQHNTIN